MPRGPALDPRAARSDVKEEKQVNSFQLRTGQDGLRVWALQTRTWVFELIRFPAGRIPDTETFNIGTQEAHGIKGALHGD